MKKRCVNGTILGLLALGVILGLGSGGTTVSAADRVVVQELITATWCGYCPPACRAGNVMLNNFGLGGAVNPNTLVFLEIHYNDDYDVAWGNSRIAYYPEFGGPPHSVTDGLTHQSGAYQDDTQQYNYYLGQYNSRRATPTDVTMQMGALQASGQTYNISVLVGLEPSGAAKSMRIHMVNALDHWPPDFSYYRNTLRSAATPNYVDVTLQPGQFQMVNASVTFDATSWANQSNIRLIAIAQQISGGKTIYQAAQIGWPFPPPPNPVGDMDGSFTIDLNDLDDFILALVDPAAYQALYPAINPNIVGDINGDGQFNGLDIQPYVIVLLGDQNPPTPNPMEFSTLPYATTSASLRMTAALATDEDSPPVQYQIEFVSGGPGGASSPWQAARMYLNAGLQVNTVYSYRVRARDSAPIPNVTEYSAVYSAATFANVPPAPAVNTPTISTLNVDVGLGSNPAYTEIAILCTTTNPADANWTGKYVGADGLPSDTPVWQTEAAWGVVTVSGLQPATTYGFAVKARNLDLFETSLSTAASGTTTAE